MITFDAVIAEGKRNPPTAAPRQNGFKADERLECSRPTEKVVRKSGSVFGFRKPFLFFGSPASSSKTHPTWFSIVSVSVETRTGRKKNF